MEVVAPESVGLSSARLARIRETVEGIVEQNKLPGALTLVARHGKVAHMEWVGSVSMETRAPLKADTIFRVYSMTKAVTAAAVMVLLEEGRFLLDDPIADYIPEFAKTKVLAGQTGNGIQLVDLERPITFRHLLTHMSGMTYPSEIVEAATAVEDTYAQAQIMRWDEPLSEKMVRLAAIPLRFQPGSAWNYGVSIDVLGALVEVISGLSFDEFLKKRFFEPLGMVDTGFNVPAEKLSRVTSIYVTDENGGLFCLDEDPQFDASKPRAFHSGGGGLFSTATDYYRFAQMLCNGGELDGARVLGRKTVELMSTSQMTRDQIPFVPPDWTFRLGYGMALGVRTLIDVAQSGNLESMGTYTWSGLAGTDFWVDPKEDMVGVLMIQVIRDISRVAHKFRTLAYAALTD